MLVRVTAAGQRVVRQVTEHRLVEIERIVEAIPADRRDHLVVALRVFSEAGGGGDRPVARAVGLD